MEFKEFHFENPFWLCLLLAIPFVCIGIRIFYRKTALNYHLEKFIDAHLLPYLLMKSPKKQGKKWMTILGWSLVWTLLVIALAGPRWGFREIDMLSKDQSLVIVLDLSESMNATDMAPSRLGRAKQKIEDLLNRSQGVKIGLIVFAADPHMMTPITEDKETIRHLLPSLETDLMFVQGSRLSSALEMASKMLLAEPGKNKAILVISDGGFEDSTAQEIAKQLADQGILVHAMGVGTSEGIPLRDRKGSIIKKQEVAIVSKLNVDKLKEISQAGGGYYSEAHYTDHAEVMILDELSHRSKAELELGTKKRIWDERFYLFILPTLPILLWWFRKGYLLAGILIIFLPIGSIHSIEYFKNSEELGKEALEEGEYEKAVKTFQDCYRKGVAHYKAGQFAEAEKMFQQSMREEVACQALYNKGNALACQNKLKEAIAAYEEVLEEWPEHQKAKDNLELIKKLLEQQQQQQKEQQQDQQDQQDKQDQQQDSKQNKQNEQNKQDGDSRQDSKQNEQDSDSELEQKEQKEQDKEKESQKNRESQAGKKPKTAEDQDADLWLDRVVNDPKTFLKNKCYIESKKNGTTGGIDPW